MTAKVEYEVTSDQAGQIPAIGTFDGSGEDSVVMDEVMLRQFEITYGCKIQDANFPATTHLTVHVISDEPAETAEDENEEEGQV